MDVTQFHVSPPSDPGTAPAGNSSSTQKIVPAGRAFALETIVVTFDVGVGIEVPSGDAEFVVGGEVVTGPVGVGTFGATGGLVTDATVEPGGSVAKAP